MNRILEKIIEKKKEDLIEKKRAALVEETLFYKAMTEAKNNPAIIAEVKFASPSEGDVFWGRKGEDSGQAGMTGEWVGMTERVVEYEEAGADAVSIITEKHFFKGDLSYVGKAKEVVALPVLQKDFVIDELQIYEARMIGADALLLIARIVGREKLKLFVRLCRELGIEPVVEVNGEGDLKKAFATGTRFIAVNARDLDTFEVDVERACRLMKEIPERFIRLGFSGIESRVEVDRYAQAGARGILIGTALMRARSIKDFMSCL